MPDSGNQLWPRLFCLPTGDRGPEQTSPISRVPTQAAGRTVFMFVGNTLQQLSLWLRSPALINVSLKARQTNRKVAQYCGSHSLSPTLLTPWRWFQWAFKTLSSGDDGGSDALRPGGRILSDALLPGGMSGQAGLLLWLLRCFSSLEFLHCTEVTLCRTRTSYLNAAPPPNFPSNHPIFFTSTAF